MTVTEIRQPAPEQCTTAVQALGIIAIDPDPDVPQTAYATGMVDGHLIGLRWAHGFQSAADVETWERFFGPGSWAFYPRSLDDAVKAASRCASAMRAHELAYGAGLHEGFRSATFGMDGASECAAQGCGRRLVPSDDVHSCLRDGEDYCRWHSDGCTSHAECAEDGI